MKATMTSAKISTPSGDATPSSRLPQIAPTPAVWEFGGRDVAEALYRPRKMDLAPQRQQPLW
ncbi:MAG: hypothetical protein GY856_22815 [bacterium]|nr:hypothetical protein [bacterium]